MWREKHDSNSNSWKLSRLEDVAAYQALPEAIDNSSSNVLFTAANVGPPSGAFLDLLSGMLLTAGLLLTGGEKTFYR